MPNRDSCNRLVCQHSNGGERNTTQRVIFRIYEISKLVGILRKKTKQMALHTEGEREGGDNLVEKQIVIQDTRESFGKRTEPSRTARQESKTVIASETCVLTETSALI